MSEAKNVPFGELEWNEDALNLNPNGCWIVLTVFDPADLDFEIPEVQPDPEPECLYFIE